MKKFWFEFGNMYEMSAEEVTGPGSSGPYYLASDVEARIAELEREVLELVLANAALKAELDHYTDEG